jgi:hypothetical protein
MVYEGVYYEGELLDERKENQKMMMKMNARFEWPRDT